MRKKFLVAGAGIAGVTIASLLKSKGHFAQIHEKDEVIGGLIRCTTHSGILFHRVGGHVFNTKSKRVSDWFWQQFDKNSEFLSAKRNARILLNGEVIGYPIENNLHQLSPPLLRAVLGDFLSIKTIESEATNFQDFLISRFGQTLFDLYFNPYNSKLWCRDLKTIPLDWLEGKLPMPNVLDILSKNILNEDESDMIHSTFYYPKSGGSQFIVDRISCGLNIRLNSPLDSIFLEESRIRTNGGDLFDSVVYTGDVRQLSRIIKNPSEDLALALRDVENLPSNGTTNVLCESNFLDFSWLYLPDDKYKCHRIINTGSFSPSNTPSGINGSCVVEFSGLHSEEFVLSELSRLPFDLKPIAINQQKTSYVIQDFSTRNKINVLKKVLKDNHIHLLGRFAEWEYYNIDSVMEAAFYLIDELTGGQ